MKVIFLDIDGVLNLRNRSRDRFGSKFHKKWVDNLKTIIDATDAKIVISSTWRSAGVLEMKKMWAYRKLPGEVIGITPHFYHKDFSVQRGSEIEWWLKEYGKFKRINWCKQEQLKRIEESIVKNYIILDDDTDMLYTQKEHVILTSNQFKSKDAIEGYGLTKNAAEKAIKILNTTLLELYYGEGNKLD